MRHCKGLKAEVAKEKPATSHTKGASSTSPKKKKHPPRGQQADLKLGSQTLLTSAPVGSHASSCCSRQDKKKTTTATSMKLHSSGKESGEKCSLSHKHSSKKHKSDKHQKKRRSNAAFPRTGKWPWCTTPIIQCICTLVVSFMCQVWCTTLPFYLWQLTFFLHALNMVLNSCTYSSLFLYFF